MCVALPTVRRVWPMAVMLWQLFVCMSLHDHGFVVIRHIQCTRSYITFCEDFLHVRTVHVYVVQGGGAGILEAFSTPARSIAKAVMQTAGELDYETIFNEANLLYTPMAYILFISFVILMPILFSNLLVRCTSE